jgi:hypothetical protein
VQVEGGRRLNDMGRRRWLAVLSLVPGVNLLFGLWLLLAPGDAGANRYGPAPAPNTRAVIMLACLLPALVLAGVFLVAVIAPQAPDDERTRAEMEQAA